MKKVLFVVLLILFGCQKDIPIANNTHKQFSIACDDVSSTILEDNFIVDTNAYKTNLTLKVVVIDSTFNPNTNGIYNIPYTMNEIVNIFEGPASFKEFYQLEGINFNISYHRIVLPQSSIQCGWTWLQNTTTSSGIAINNQTYVVWVIGPFCPYGGLAQVNGKRAYITTGLYSTNYLKRLAIHEVGHNLGLAHAGQFTNNTLLEYGDRTTPMGEASLYQMNAPQRWMRNWMPKQHYTSVQSGVYELYATDERIGLSLINLRNTNWVISTRKRVDPFDFTISSLDLYQDNSLYIHQFTKSNSVGDKSVLYYILGPGQSIVINNKTILNNYQVGSPTVRVSIN